MKDVCSVPRLRVLCAAMLLLVGVLAGGSARAAEPPLPQPLPPTGSCPADNIYYGAVPQGGERSRVLVFVHGLGGLAQDWWTDAGSGIGVNDMYFQAHAAGYRTAFVDMSMNLETPADCTIIRWPGNTFDDNGQTLSRQLDAITQHYGVPTVDVVAHSKGGVDTEAAIIRWGAWAKIRDVFTLSSPLQGSLVADYACGPNAPDWIKPLAGPGPCSLQTSIIQDFRATADASSLDDAISFYSGAGNKCRLDTEPPCDRLGAYLLTQPVEEGGGDNDGLVSVASATRPGAETLFLQPWSHYEVALGRNSFPYILEVLRSQAPTETKVYLPLIGSPSG